MDRQKLPMLRGLVNVSLISLVFGAILNLLAGILGSYYVLIIGFLAVLITFYCYHRADREAASSMGYYLWRHLPTLIFITVPIIAHWYSGDTQWALEDIIHAVQIGCSFPLPIICLLYVERVLKNAQQ
jgi:O-antigen/teichoic acid export membrane protein